MGIFRRNRRNKDARKSEIETVAAPPTVSEDQLVSEATIAVLPGFRTKAEAIDRVRDAYELSPEDQRVERVVEEVWERRLAEQTSRSEQSDYEKLRLAFDDLSDQGVVARMNFSCCNTCGTDEIDYERTQIEAPEGYPFLEREYTFFHQQDADCLAASPAILFLTFSSWGPADDIDPQLLEKAKDGDIDARAEVVALTDAAVGRRVSAALRQRGLEVQWSGNADTRIAVEITDWRKPLPA